MENKTECCGTCKSNKCVRGTFICNSEESDGNGFETSYDDYCVEFENRESEV